jgi:thioredoxin reductase (NADPH)
MATIEKRAQPTKASLKRDLNACHGLAVAICIFGRPNKPKEYRLLPSLKERLLFDMTSLPIQNEDVLVVGGGDTAAEYVQYLHAQLNRLSLSYRQAQFTCLSKQNHDALFAKEERNEVEVLRGSNIKQVEHEAGRPRVVFNEPDFPTRIFERVIYALGGTTPTNFLQTLGISFSVRRFMIFPLARTSGLPV